MKGQNKKGDTGDEPIPPFYDEKVKTLREGVGAKPQAASQKTLGFAQTYSLFGKSETKNFY